MNGPRHSKPNYILERENNRIAEGLASKVAQMKGIAIDMRDESQAHNSFLSTFSEDFHDTDGLLSNTRKKLTHVVNSGSQNRSLMCYMLIGSVFLFFLFYYGVGTMIGKGE